MGQPLPTLRGYVAARPGDLAARGAGRTTVLTLGALLGAALLLAAAVGLRPAGEAGPARDAALTAPAAGGAAASAAGVQPVQAEIGLREYLPGEAAGGGGGRPIPLGGLLEYLPGEGPAVAAARDGTGPLEYLPGELPAVRSGGEADPLVGLQP